MMSGLNYEETSEFKKDLKRLLKKYRSLSDDLEVAKKAAIELFHIQRLNNQSVFPISGFCSDEILVCKLKKFACKAMKGKGVKSGIRVIYAYHVQTSRVVFIEMYFKPEQKNEDTERIGRYLSGLEIL